ncbi:hypothetical protein [Micromonospora sp. A200]|uniref:hypothetical protein n=1 Tax=Micromonospora sp. A200 TaxID=2940568 RepID=UPI002473E843|nr:hypothetical protein [Micromonospora sp. A200]
MLLVVGIMLVQGMVGARGVLAGLLFFLIPPGVLGESSLLGTLVALAGLAVIALTYRPSSKTQATAAILYGVCFIALAVGISIVGGMYFALVYVIAGVVALLAISRAEFVTATFRGIGCVIAPLACSYGLTLVFGFAGNEIGSLTLGSRQTEFYMPFTLATAGPPFIEGSRRFAPLVGEPGLAVYYFIPIITLIAVARFDNRLRALAVGAVIVAATFTQSLGTLIAIGAGLLGFSLAHLAVRKRRPVAATILASVVALIAVPLVVYVLTYKAGIAAESTTDRGIMDAGSRSSASLGNINLIVAYSNDVRLATALTCALIAIGFAAVRHLGGLLAFVMFAITAVFAQPSQWQIGGWMLLAMAVVASSPAGSAPPSGQTRTSKAWKEGVNHPEPRRVRDGEPPAMPALRS